MARTISWVAIAGLQSTWSSPFGAVTLGTYTLPAGATIVRLITYGNLEYVYTTSGNDPRQMIPPTMLRFQIEVVSPQRYILLRTFAPDVQFTALDDHNLLTNNRVFTVTATAGEQFCHNRQPNVQAPKTGPLTIRTQMQCVRDPGRTSGPYAAWYYNIGARAAILSP